MIERFKPVAVAAALEAGEILKQGFSDYSGFTSKGPHDIVTETDLRSERAVLKRLAGAFPEHAVRSEETGSTPRSSEYCWIIDPLDGTSNFASANPYFSVSIALAREGRVILGVVYSPLTAELYQAVHGQGAFLNDRAIRVSPRNSLADSFVGIAFSADEGDTRRGIELLGRAAGVARRTVVNFAPALDLCSIARGRLDGLIDNGSTPEDHAAGSLILLEAGGTIQNLGASGWNVFRTGVVASNGRIQGALLGLV